MSKRRKKRKPEPTVPARFKIGDRVWVRHGVTDDDHPDMPLGGWAGTIYQVHKGRMYSIHWSRETLASIHPIYKKRCAIDGRFLEDYCLGEDELEPDPGSPLAIQQPSEITPRPLSAENQGDRVRMIFGLTSDDYLPAVDDDSLETYYDYLVKRMALTADARYFAQENFLDASPIRRVTVVALDRETAWDVDEGILCRVSTLEGEEVVPLTDLEFRRTDPNYQLRDDFAAWFFGELSADQEDEWDDEDFEENGDDEEDSGGFEVMTWRDVALVLLECVAFAACYGAVVGSAVSAMPWARWAAYIGGGAWGLFVALANVKFAHWEMSEIEPKFRKVIGAVLGLSFGILQGVFVGVMVVAFIGAILGGIAGLFVRRLLGDTKVVSFHVFPGSVLLGAACGVTAQAFYLDRSAAIDGFRLGAKVGLGCATVVCFVLLPLVCLTVRRTSR